MIGDGAEAHRDMVERGEDSAPEPFPRMSEEEALGFFGHLFGGRHHIPSGGVKEWGLGWEVNFYGDLSTWDFDVLTRLVFLAHDRAFRVELGNGGPRRIKIIIHKRVRTGGISERHPTIDEALERWRERNPKP